MTRTVAAAAIFAPALATMEQMWDEAMAANRATPYVHEDYDLPRKALDAILAATLPAEQAARTSYLLSDCMESVTYCIDYSHREAIEVERVDAGQAYEEAAWSALVAELESAGLPGRTADRVASVTFDEAYRDRTQQDGDAEHGHTLECVAGCTLDAAPVLTFRAA